MKLKIIIDTEKNKCIIEEVGTSYKFTYEMDKIEEVNDIIADFIKETYE